MQFWPTGFNLMIHNLQFTIQFEIFMNQILAENAYFTNHTERITQDYDL